MGKQSTDVKVRQARFEDIQSVVALNREAYPALTEDNIVWGPAHVKSHQRIFRQGQFVAVSAGNVGNLPAVENMDVNYAQAAVLTPSDFAFARDGINAESECNEETILVCDLDLDDLHRSTTGGTVTPRLDRRSDLFRFSSNIVPRGSNADEMKPLGDLPAGETDE